MVHGLETIKRLNARTGEKPDGHNKAYVPPEIASKPSLARAFTNRPWTKKELGGAEDVYATYAKSAAAPFRRETQPEGLRT